MLWIGSIIAILILSAISATYALSSPKQEPISALFAPSNFVSESQIKVYDSKVILEIPNAQWASYLDTKSMSPVLDSGAHGIEVVPQSRDELHIGDIVAYENSLSTYPVVHRIVGIRQDGLGTYYVVKGDNNETADPIKVRFDQIRYKLIAIIY